VYWMQTTLLTPKIKKKCFIKKTNEVMAFMVIIKEKLLVIKINLFTGFFYDRKKLSLRFAELKIITLVSNSLYQQYSNTQNWSKMFSLLMHKLYQMSNITPNILFFMSIVFTIWFDLIDLFIFI